MADVSGGLGEGIPDRLLLGAVADGVEGIRRPRRGDFSRVLLVVGQPHVLGTDSVRIAQDHRLLHGVLQLPHVPGPRVLEDRLFGGAGKRALSGPVLARESAAVVGGEQDRVPASLPKGGHDQGHHRDAVEEVGAETPRGHLLLQVPVGGGDQAEVDADRRGSSHPDQFALLEDPQELDLQTQRELAQLVQEQGPSVGLLDPALLERSRPREGALLVPEELALHEVLGNGSAVDGDEGPFLAAAGVVQEPGQQLLAGSRLPEQVDRNLGCRDPGRLAQERDHHGTFVQDLRRSRRARGVLLQILDGLALVVAPCRLRGDLRVDAAQRVEKVSVGG